MIHVQIYQKYQVICKTALLQQKKISILEFQVQLEVLAAIIKLILNLILLRNKCLSKMEM